MEKKNYSLVLDVGTSGIKAFVFDRQFHIVTKSFSSIQQKIKEGGIVEQDPLEIFEISKTVLQDAFRSAKIPEDAYCGFGVTNQRETVIAWDAQSGAPLYPAIVWQDTRTKTRCISFSDASKMLVREKTGLSLDPYFSASKIAWLCEYEGWRKGSIVGTVDSWLLWNMTVGNPHITDVTNASRTLLWNIETKEWDDELLGMWKIQKDILPRVISSRGSLGMLNKDIFGFSMPIKAVCGDQASSWYAAYVLHASDTKITFGTGIFMVQRISKKEIFDEFFTTVIPSDDGGVLYAIEKKIESFCAEQVTPHLGDLEALRPIMDMFAKKTAEAITTLPYPPKKIVVDGGVTQSDDLLEFLKRYIPDISIIKQDPYDGTALGTAALIFESD